MSDIDPRDGPLTEIDRLRADLHLDAEDLWINRDDLMREIEELEAEANRLRHEHCWIPVSERLPESSADVDFVATSPYARRPWLYVGWRESEWWHVATTVGLTLFVNDVICWRPRVLPPLPEEATT